MKKQIILSALFAAVCVCAQAAPVSPSEAVARVRGQQGRHAAPRFRVSTMTLDRTYQSPSGAPAVYLFRSSDSAVLLPADDVARPVLGYFDSLPSGEMPPQLEWWIGEYSREIEYAASQGLTAVSEPATDREPIAPQLTTVWNQSEPFSDNCPLEGDRRTPTGCMATALAQIMNYWEYPDEPTGSITYTDSNGHVRSCDFSGKPFRWDDMLDDYNSVNGSMAHITPEQASAVAWLMQAAGYATQMNYAVMGSGAYTFNVAPAVKRYFNYNAAVASLQRDYYSAETWENLVYDHLSKVGPVLYTGANFNDMGHAFVCDGYRDNGYFHINWGWGGTYDGYFLLSALTPAGQGIGGHAGGYNYLQEAVFNLAPPEHETVALPEDSPITLGGNLIVTQFGRKNLKLSTDEALYLPGAIYNAGKSAAQVVVGLRAVSQSTGEAAYVTDNVAHRLETRQGIQPLEFSVDLPQGEYKATLVVKVDGGDWESPAHSAAKTDFIYLTIGTGGNISMATAPTPAELVVDNLRIQTDVYWATPYRISFTVSTKSALKLEETLQPMFYYDSGDLATVFARSDEITVAFNKPGSEEKTVTTAMQVLMDEEFHNTAFLGLVSLNTGRVVIETPVEIKHRPEVTTLAQSEFSFKGDPTAADASGLTFRYSVECASGYYAGPVFVCLHKETDGEPQLVGQFTSKGLWFLHEGEKCADEIQCSLSSAQPGEEYRATLGYYDRDGRMQQLGTEPILLTIGGGGSGIPTVEADSRRCDGIYDLSGRRLRSASRPGCYIINGVKTLLR